MRPVAFKVFPHTPSLASQRLQKVTAMSKRSLFAYLGTLFAFLVLDGLWLGVLMGPTYKSLLGPLMLDQPRLLPAVLFYLLYALGCVVFVVLPSASWQRAARLGALLGLVAYGTYDLSNWATLHGWSAALAIMDMAWGTFLTAACCTVGYLCAHRVHQ
jgi:uncharacterized membrane protein